MIGKITAVTLTVAAMLSMPAQGADVQKNILSFSDLVGWDSDDQLYDNVEFSRWDKGFPDVPYRLDIDTVRNLPYEDNVAFFLAELVPPEGDAFHPICPRNLLKRVLARARELGLDARIDRNRCRSTTRLCFWSN